MLDYIRNEAQFAWATILQWIKDNDISITNYMLQVFFSIIVFAVISDILKKSFDKLGVKLTGREDVALSIKLMLGLIRAVILISVLSFIMTRLSLVEVHPLLTITVSSCVVIILVIQGVLTQIIGNAAISVIKLIKGDDAVVMSCHGIEESVWQPKLIDAVLHNAKVFTLTSGGKDVRIIGEILCKLEEDYGVKYEIVAGVNLYSYEKIVTLSAMKCAAFPEDGLVVLMIKNKKPIAGRLSPGLSDDAFLRNKTPMSKEEIRALSICKLGLTENAVVYDIGGGSGSVSVEIGLLHPSINVYTVEFKEEACKLIRANINKFNLKNVKLYEGVAPEALENLPAPTHVFIGGSGGRLEEILRTIKAKGNNTRIVINAVTLETIAEVNGILKNYAISDADVVQVAISKAKTIGDYNVMQAQNPVYVVSFSL